MQVSLLRLLAVLALSFAACGSDPDDLSPDAALTNFLVAMEQSTHAPEQRKAAFDWLDQQSRKQLSERADLTASLAGRKLAPWELLVPGRVSFAGLARGGVKMSTEVSGDRARVRIPVEGQGPVEVAMIREDGRWHVVLGLTPTSSE
jgi:hypothetical protein